MPEPIIPDNRTIQNLASEFAQTKVAQGLSREQVAVAIEGMDNLKGRVNYQGDSRTLALLDGLFSKGSPVTPQNVINALEDTGVSPKKLRDATSMLRNVDVLDNMRMTRILADRGMDNRALNRVMGAVDNVVAAAGKGLSKRGLAGVGALLGGALKLGATEATGIVGDVLGGTPADAPGGLSGGEISEATDEQRQRYGFDKNIEIENPTYERARLEPTYGMTAGEARRFDRRAKRRMLDSQGPDTMEETLAEMQREEEGESMIAVDATSPTSGNNNILRSLGQLLGR